MDSKRKVERQIEPLDEEELEKDLRFLLNNHSDTTDEFIEQAIPVIKYHINQVMASYQERIMEELTYYLKGEIANVILRVRKDDIFKETKNEKSDW